MISIPAIQQASANLSGVVLKSPLEYSERLSTQYGANVYLKREDLQKVRSFKIRGAYNFIFSLDHTQKSSGVVCASAGNHAQGVAYSCAKMNIKGVIFMPIITPNQKIDKVKYFGGDMVEVRLVGKTFDETSVFAQEYCEKNNMVYVHPYNNETVMAGQGTIGLEITDQADFKIDFVVCAIGGGGLIGGVGSWFKQQSQNTQNSNQTQIIGIESEGCQSMSESFLIGSPTRINSKETFCDGIAVMVASPNNFALCQEVVDKIYTVPEGQVATDMIEIYQKDGIIVEPAGAVPISGLSKIADQIKGKNVVVVVCGGNNDINRYPDIVERSLVWQGKKKYFIVNFAQKSGQLRMMLNNVLGENDDITRFEYIKKTNREKGPALVGIQLFDPTDYEILTSKMNECGIEYQELRTDDLMYQYLV